jgi:hypothetical protein
MKAKIQKILGQLENLAIFPKSFQPRERYTLYSRDIKKTHCAPSNGALLTALLAPIKKATCAALNVFTTE